MTKSYLPSAFLKEVAGGARDEMSSALCMLERIERVIDRDDVQVDEVFPLLGFKRTQLSPADLVWELQDAIVSDIEQLNYEYERDRLRLHDHFQNQAELNSPLISPYSNDDLKKIEVVYRLTMDDGEKYDLFVMEGKLFECVSEQVEMQISRALQISPFPRKVSQVPALFKPQQLPDAAP